VAEAPVEAEVLVAEQVEYVGVALPDLEFSRSPDMEPQEAVPALDLALAAQLAQLSAATAAPQTSN